MCSTVKINSAKAWWLAARPKTLAGAATPVIMGGACAWMWLCGDGASGWTDTAAVAAGRFDWTAFILCMLFAWIMQVDANFVNDYFDFRKGGDTELRLGPKRACAQGWITPQAMKTGIIVTTLLACAVGTPLIWTGGLWMLAVGAACVLFCFLYTTRFSRMGLGDLLVLVFFGLVPVGGTYYVQTGVLNVDVLVLSLVSGVVIDTLLTINNYRDIEQDRVSGKMTLIVRFGASFGRQFYLALGIVAVLLCLWFVYSGRLTWLEFIWAPCIYLYMHLMTWRSMCLIRQGEKLNSILGETSRNMLFLGILLSVALC